MRKARSLLYVEGPCPGGSLSREDSLSSGDSMSREIIIIIIIIIVIYSRSCLQFPLFEMFICINEKWYIYKAVLPVPRRD